jgi:hypothetical protein
MPKPTTTIQALAYRVREAAARALFRLAAACVVLGAILVPVRG